MEIGFKMDIFRALIEKGILLKSGLDKEFNSYRIIKFKGQEFKLTLTKEKK